MDETKLKVNGKQVYIWAAMDVETRVTLSRRGLETYLFLNKARKKCLNRAKLITDNVQTRATDIRRKKLYGAVVWIVEENNKIVLQQYQCKESYSGIKGWKNVCGVLR